MRLIDADTLKAVFEEKSTEAVCGVELCKAIIFRIDEAPTVDAVPVIRCKECRFYQRKYCTAWGDETVAVACETDADGYCYLAERKPE